MKFRNLLIVFLIALFIECVANTYGLLAIQYISKPSLMIILAFYLVRNSKRVPKEKNLILLALLFSWLGDVFLLVEKSYKFLFIFGLVSFLIAHIIYVFYFWQIRKYNLKNPKINFLYVGLVLVYTIAFYLYLLPHLNKMQIPVLIYTSVISLMLLTSLHASDLENQTFGKICVLGTILFAISDSILAYNRFVSPIPLASIYVMVSYSISQLLITEGALRNLRTNNVSLSQYK